MFPKSFLRSRPAGRFAAMLLSLLVSAAVSKPALAADPSSPEGTAPTGNRVFLEVLGAGLLYSLNYEITISDKAGIRLGVGGLPFSDVSYIVGLAMPTVILGRGDHKAVISAGVGIGWIDRINLLESQEVFVGYGIGSIGYQFQPRPRGFFARGSFTPVFTDQQVSAWGGLGLGVAF